MIKNYTISLQIVGKVNRVSLVTYSQALLINWGKFAVVRKDIDPTQITAENLVG